MNPVLSHFPILKRQRNPCVALLVGFLFGGVGLAIYFRSTVDLFAPLVFYVGLVFLHAPAAGFLAGALLAGAYGFSRALDSNHRLEVQLRESVGSTVTGPVV